MFKKLLIIFASIFITATSSVFADYKEEFPWAAEAVKYCVEKGILQGDEKGDLLLGDNLTQAQCAALIVRTFDIDYSNANVKLPVNHWAKDEIDKVSGYLLRPDDFDADEFATREMFIATLARSLGIPADTKVSVLKENFKDYSVAYSEYLPYLAAAYKRGLVQGSENKLFPKDNLFRAEAVTLIYRVLTSKDDTVTIKPAPPKTQTHIMGDAQISLASAKKWAKARGAHERFIDIAQYYWLYGDLTGMRPEVLYAQAAHETNFGKYGGRVLPEMNNWAGIKKYGATGDETEDHETFETPEDGVRGHFNHMCAYTGVSPIGETHGRYSSVVRLKWAGTIKYVEQLGGTWCPDTQYGNLVLKLIAQMLEY